MLVPQVAGCMLCVEKPSIDSSMMTTIKARSSRDDSGHAGVGNAGLRHALSVRSDQNAAHRL